MSNMVIKTSFGGPCIYKQGILPDGAKTGHVQYTGQNPKELHNELLGTLTTGRDDVRSFVDMVLAR